VLLFGKTCWWVHLAVQNGSESTEELTDAIEDVAGL
jgi:hypothetical protein